MDIWLAALIAAALTFGGALSIRALGEQRIARHQAKIDDRIEAGKDRYFEELRGLKAYDPRRFSVRRNGIIEFITILASFVSLTLMLSEWSL